MGGGDIMGEPNGAFSYEAARAALMAAGRPLGWACGGGLVVAGRLSGAGYAFWGGGDCGGGGLKVTGGKPGEVRGGGGGGNASRRHERCFLTMICEDDGRITCGSGGSCSQIELSVTAFPVWLPLHCSEETYEEILIPGRREEGGILLAT